MNSGSFPRRRGYPTGWFADRWFIVDRDEPDQVSLEPNAAGAARGRRGLDAVKLLLNQPAYDRGGAKKGNIMRQTVCGFTVAALICATACETSYATPIAPPIGPQAGSGRMTLAYSQHDRHSRRYIVIPRTRDYGWWPQGEYRWFPFDPARWGYWCEPADHHHLSCGLGDRD
jgi:hypothetical protein